MAQTTTVVSEDTVVKASAGRVNSMIVAFAGATAGKIYTIRDNASIGGGTLMFQGVVEVANGTLPIPFVHRQGDPGLKCGTGIVFQQNDVNGKIIATIIYE